MLRRQGIVKHDPMGCDRVSTKHFITIFKNFTWFCSKRMSVIRWNNAQIMSLRVLNLAVVQRELRMEIVEGH